MDGEIRKFQLTDGLLSVPTGTEHDRVRCFDRQMLDAAWGELSVELARLALALSLTSHQAEDVVQDVYVQAIRKAPAGLNRAELRRWLFRVATNRCRLEHRRRRRWYSVVERLKRTWLGQNGQAKAATATPAEGDTGADEQRRVVRHGLDLLDDDQRTLLVLRYFAGFNSREIGQMLDMPDSTVRGHLRQARLCLARELEGTGYDES